jgi:DNA-binding transcriptional LysR family regulator
MDIRRLDLNLLLLLDGLLSSGNLSATARRLGISQPSASAGLSKLRHFFRDELFIRTGRGLRPTPFADGLKEPVRFVVDKISQEILVKPAFEPRESERVFTLTMPDLGQVVFLPPIIDKLHAEAPLAGIKCVSVAYEAIREALEDGLVDLAIGHFPDLMEPAVKSQFLFEDPFVCIVRGDHPKVLDHLSLDDFLKMQHLCVEHQGRQQSFEYWNVELTRGRQILLEIPDFLSVPRLVASSDMISIVPLSLASRFEKVYGLRIIDPPMGLPHIVLKQFWHRRMDNDPAVQWLRGLVADCLMGLDPRDPAEPGMIFRDRVASAHGV